VHVEGASFVGAHLEGAGFLNVCVKGADFLGAHVEEPFSKRPISHKHSSTTPSPTKKDRSALHQTAGQARSDGASPARTTTLTSDRTDRTIADLRALAEGAAAGPQMFKPGEIEAMIALAERDPTVRPILEGMVQVVVEFARELKLELPPEVEARSAQRTPQPRKSELTRRAQRAQRR
jgi:hypothetical protein